MLCFPVLIKKDLVNHITSVLIPDLQIELVAERDFDKRLSHSKLVQHINTIITDKIAENNLNNYKIVLPKSLKEYQHCTVNKNDVWIEVYVPISYRKGNFEKILPLFGNFCTVISLFCNSLVALMALMLTTNNKNEKAELVYGIVGAAVTFLVTYMMYAFSGASNTLASLGRHIDNVFRKKTYEDTNEATELFEKTKKINQECSTKKVLCGLTASALITTNIAVTGIRSYEETKALGENFSQKYPIVTPFMVELLATTLLGSLTVTNSAFQGYFAKEATNTLTSKKVDTHSNDAEHGEEKPINENVNSYNSI